MSVQVNENGDEEICAMLHSEPEVKGQQAGPRSNKLPALIRRQGMVISILLAVAVGLGLGLGLQACDLSDDVIMLISLPGELYMRLIKALIVPLLICLVFNTAVNIEPKLNGRTALFTLVSFFICHVIGVIIAVCLFFVFRKDPKDSHETTEIKASLRTSDLFADLLRNLMPDNVVAATFSQTVTSYESKVVPAKVASDNGTSTSREVLKRSVDRVPGINILGLLFICTTMGMAAQRVLPKQTTIRTLFDEAQKLMEVFTQWVLWITPLAVVSLIAGSVANVSSVSDTFESMGIFIALVVLGLSIQTFATFPVLLFIITRRNPFVIFTEVSRPLAVTFAASSTSVGFPHMLVSCAQFGVHPEIANVVLAMGISLHKSGSAVFIASAALFIGQLNGSLDSMDTIFVLAILSTFLSMVIPPVPSSSIMTLVLILSSLNIPVNDVAVLFAIEWFLDRMRTMVNMLGTVSVAIAADAFCAKRLRRPVIPLDLEEGKGQGQGDGETLR